ncbi:unnamed protein product [Miscanthus lutarioriparius]|uniref:Uncharacterized protein n=1 Tax=Miscanthus lutarioriparius TaxID=422564 RepID=A0A811R8Z8_9POAL|nr:unnamed protein product [Miscanthus lutarioriparius]
MANPRYHNAKVDAGDDDVDREDLLRRFNWQVSCAGVIEEIRRRRRHEDALDRHKPRAWLAARMFVGGPSTSSFYKLGLSCVPAGITTSPPPPPWPPPQPSPRRVRLPSSNATFVSFPRRPLPATTLALSHPSQLSLVPAANPKYHNAKVDAGDEDVDGEELLRRFNWQVSRAGVMEEIRRRRRHEDARDKRKRKARSAARRFRRSSV